MIRSNVRLRPSSGAVLAVAAMCLGACGPAPALTVLLTDAPQPEIRRAVVTLEEVYLQGGTGGRHTLRDTPVTVDLLTLANAVVTLVRDAPFPEGEWQALRLVVSSAFLEVDDGAGGTTLYASDDATLPDGEEAGGHLQLPSFASRGLQVDLPDDLEIQDSQKVLLVDFDVAQSFGHDAGDGWVMHPVLEASDALFTAAIRLRLDGTAYPELWPSLEQCRAELIDADGAGEGELPLVDPDGVGRFEATFLYLDPHEVPFSLGLDCPANVTAALDVAFPKLVDVSSAATTTVDAVLL